MVSLSLATTALYETQRYFSRVEGRVIGCYHIVAHVPRQSGRIWRSDFPRINEQVYRFRRGCAKDRRLNPGTADRCSRLSATSTALGVADISSLDVDKRAGR